MKINDLVAVHKTSAYSREHERFYVGIVQKIGRKYVYIQLTGSHYYRREARFHIETRLSMDTYYGRGYKYYSNLYELQEDLLFDRRKSALRNYGISFAYYVHLDSDRVRRVCEAFDLEDSVYDEVKKTIDNLAARMLELSNNNNTEV